MLKRLEWDMAEAEGEVHEVIIVKHRGHGDEDGHHGGVWKIAFADFMTAMMAFFLVMWLISASNQTKSSIAQYFNPVQLVGATKQQRGLQDPKPDDASAPPEKSKTPSREEHAPPPSPPQSKAPPASKAENALFADPYASLSEIAGAGSSGAGEKPAQSQEEGKRQGQGAVGAKGGEAFRDPFSPIPPAPMPDLPPETKDLLAAVAPPPPPAPPPGAPGKGAPKPQPEAGAAAAKAGTESLAELQQQILAAVTPDGSKAGTQQAPQLDIRKTDEGLLVSLTDKADYAMFSIGSAEPDRKVVLMIGKIGQLLKARPGKIVVRGYTDARPFKSATYDNWRLSSARAHMAQYMLVRGGLDEKRIERIEGYADHNLKNPKDPEGPANRRIEILLKNEPVKPEPQKGEKAESQKSETP